MVTGEVREGSTCVNHGTPWFSRPLDGHEGVLKAHGARAHAGACLGPSWALLGCSAGRFGHPLGMLGCHGPFLDALMQHEGEQRQPNLEIHDNQYKYDGVRVLGKEVREAWRLILVPVCGQLQLCWAALGSIWASIGPLGAVIACAWTH